MKIHQISSATFLWQSVWVATVMNLNQRIFMSDKIIKIIVLNRLFYFFYFTTNT